MAAASPSVDDLTAKIIDRVATLNPEKLHDGAFRKELLDFRDEGFRRGQSVNLGNGRGADGVVSIGRVAQMPFLQNA